MKKKMKMKIIAVLMLCVMFTMVLPYAAYADNSAKIIDDAGLFTESEINDLNEKIALKSEACGADIVIITVGEETYVKDTYDYAEEYYITNEYGFGDDKDGFLFIIDMYNREFWVYASNYNISEGEIYLILDDIEPFMIDGEFYGAADAFLDSATYHYIIDTPEEEYTEEYYNDITIVKSEGNKLFSQIIYSVVIGIAAGLLLTGILYSYGNRTNKMATKASTYLNGSSFTIKNQVDKFITTSVSRVRITSDSSSGGGSSSGTSTRSSSGGGHGGGRKF